MGLLRRLFGSENPFPLPSAGDVSASLFEGEEEMEVVGESRYQDTLARTFAASPVERALWIRGTSGSRSADSTLSLATRSK